VATKIFFLILKTPVALQVPPANGLLADDLPAVALDGGVPIELDARLCLHAAAHPVYMSPGCVHISQSKRQSEAGTRRYTERLVWNRLTNRLTNLQRRNGLADESNDTRKLLELAADTRKDIADAYKASKAVVEALHVYQCNNYMIESMMCPRDRVVIARTVLVLQPYYMDSKKIDGAADMIIVIKTRISNKNLNQSKHHVHWQLKDNHIFEAHIAIKKMTLQTDREISTFLQWCDYHKDRSQSFALLARKFVLQPLHTGSRCKSARISNFQIKHKWNLESHPSDRTAFRTATATGHARTYFPLETLVSIRMNLRHGVVIDWLTSNNRLLLVSGRKGKWKVQRMKYDFGLPFRALRRK
jgi:hypothetical protein